MSNKNEIILSGPRHSKNVSNFLKNPDINMAELYINNDLNSTPHILHKNKLTIHTITHFNTKLFEIDYQFNDQHNYEIEHYLNATIYKTKLTEINYNNNILIININNPLISNSELELYYVNNNPDRIYFKYNFLSNFNGKNFIIKLYLSDSGAKKINKILASS